MRAYICVMPVCVYGYDRYMWFMCLLSFCKLLYDPVYTILRTLCAYVEGVCMLRYQGVRGTMRR